MEIFPYDRIKRYVFPYIDANMYIFAENGEALVIDPHISAEADQYLKENGVTKVTILLTHEHFDHTCGIPWFREHYEVRVICQEETLNARRQRFFCRPFVLSIFMSDETGRERSKALEAEYSSYAITAEQTFCEALDIDWQGHMLHLEHLLGHSPASSLIILDEQCVFSGDTLIPDAEPTIRWPWSDAKIYWEKAVPRLLQISKGSVIYPGHRNIVRMENLIYENHLFVTTGIKG